MSFRGSCPEPLFSDGEARSPIFFSSRSNGILARLAFNFTFCVSHFAKWKISCVFLKTVQM